MHSYDVSGHPKEKVIFFIAILSVTMSAWLNDSVDLFAQLLEKPISITISLATTFGILYFLFSKFLWKHKWFAKIFKYPNLNGKYSIVGKSFKKTTGETFDWGGILLIKQDWDKILVSMKSKDSSSESFSVQGKITYYPMKGYELNYSYDNTPNNNIAELHKHVGNCTVSFNEDTETAIGNYYNDMKNRENYGSMELRRING
ncbi:Cap15 family cyclic dinucleotide receptor domain-containing protein [Sedimentibacter saalensis]|uniref:Uncharacterized protein n=1 Tax=Sedimentibacter saalensis TaxID=130788 RepID=A0A562J3C6_9FIRM|nr:hypothetical protein [Sedimentibacter saalensis]TWH77761.1 hypothetical protein LY60_03270 [Sedimentibacter saalensis]